MTPQEKHFSGGWLHEQIINISKAGAYDIVSKHNVELQEENKRLKDRIKFLEDLINETIDDLKKPLQ